MDGKQGILVTNLIFRMWIPTILASQEAKQLIIIIIIIIYCN